MSAESGLVASWLAKAEGDLRLADLALSADPPVSWGAAFHAQQAAEKLLKALLTSHRIEFRRTHNIDYLLQLCVRVEPEADGLREKATKLTDYAVGSRYAIPEPDVTELEAREAVGTARQVRAFVLARVPPEIEGNEAGA